MDGMAAAGGAAGWSIARAARSPWGRAARAGLAAAGSIVALLLGLAAAGAALLLLRDGLLHLWHEVAPVYRNRGLNSRADFSWFFYAMDVAWKHIDPARLLYDVASEDRFMAQRHFGYDHLDLYGYPPPFALLWAPLAALPYAAARTLWTQINLAALGVGLVAAAWHASPRPAFARVAALTAAGLWSAALQPNFYWGQPNAVILALVALGLLGLCRDRPGRAAAALGGAAIGLAAVLKLTPAAILCYLPVRWLLWRLGPGRRAAASGSRGGSDAAARARAAGIAAVAGWATAGGLCAASGIVLGWSVLWTYVRRTVPAVERSAWAHGPAPWNQSLRGFLMLFEHSTHALARQSDLFGLAVFAVAVATVALRPALDFRLEAALAALLTLLPSPSLEDHHFTVAILPAVLVAGYLLDRVRSWRRAWLWPLAGLFAVAAWELAAPGALVWPPRLLRPQVTVAVPPARYTEAYLLGAASYGPVHWILGLVYRGAPTGSAAADWPDWWSPGQPLPPAIPGEALQGGRVANGHVGLYAFGYPLRGGATLTGLRFPASLPRSASGGPEDLHIVALTLRRASGGFVAVALPYNARGLAPFAGFSPAAALSFDGAGDVFWTPSWQAGPFFAAVGGAAVPFTLPRPTAARDTLSVPAPAGTTAAGGGARPPVLGAAFSKAPGLVALVLLFAVAVGAAAGDGPRPAPAAAPQATTDVQNAQRRAAAGI